MADITLCVSFECPLRAECRRAWDGLPTPMKQSWAVFEWRQTDSGVTCLHIVPREEDSK